MPTLCKVSQDPLIFHSYNFGHIYTPVKQLAPYIQKGKNIHIVLTLNMSIRPPQKIENLARAYHHYAKRYPWIIVTVLANEPEELELLRTHDIRSELCNQNCLIDERCYTIRQVPKKYDAISNSRMASYKRLELLSKVNNCALLTYFLDPSDYDYEKRILPHAGGNNAACPNLICPQIDSNGWHWFDTNKICEELSASRCGIIASKEEGACFAAVEYLLCGLPVVTTPNIGGRDAMFDKDYVIWADPDPDSIAEAVKKAIALPISSQEIRERTIEKIRNGRKTYSNILNAIAKDEGIEKDFMTEWDSFYVNKMINNISEEDAITLLDNSGVKTHYSLLHRLHNAHKKLKYYIKRYIK